MESTLWMLLIKRVNIDPDTLELLLLMSIVDRQLCFSKELTIMAVKMVQSEVVQGGRHRSVLTRARLVSDDMDRLQS